MKIAMVSEHASPLAAPGEVDAGGQNLHVAELSAALCRGGHEVTVHTRRDAPDLPPEVETSQGYRVVHVNAGPPGRVARMGVPLEDDVMNETYGVAGRDRVVARYSWDRIAWDTLRVYYSMAGVPRSADLVKEGS